jgi:hypothetical protein
LNDRSKVLDDDIDGSYILPVHRLFNEGFEAWQLVKKCR